MIILQCKSLDPVSWQPRAFGLLPQPDGVDIWRFHVCHEPDEANSLLAVLTIDEQRRSARYRQPEDRNRFITARSGLRKLLACYLNKAPDEIELLQEAGGKPHLKQKPGATILEYNLAHAGQWVIIGCATHGLGVDIEKIDPHFAYSEIVSHSFSQPERQFVESSDQPRKNFFLLWTRKEALAKASGAGLRDNLQSLPCLTGAHQVQGRDLGLSESWCMDSFEVAADYIATVARPLKQEPVQFWHGNLCQKEISK